MLGAILTNISTTVALPANAQVGTTVTGTISFTNTTGVATTVTATITINGSTTLVSVFVPANSSRDVTVSVPVTTLGAAVSVNAGTTSVPETSTADNSASQALAALIPDVSVSITLPASAPAGSTVLATVTYTNVGTGTADNVIGTTTLSSGQSVPTALLGTLAPGAITTTNIIVTVPASGTVLATATVATSTPEITLTNNTSNALLGANAVADLSVTIAAPTAATPGQTITALVTITNNGPSAAQNVTTLVTLPNGSVTTVVVANTLPVGSISSVLVAYQVPAAQTATMTWSANVNASTLDNNTVNNTATAATTVIRVFNAAVSGRVWLDTNGDRIYTSGVDRDLTGWNVELLQGSTVVGTSTSGADGRYTIGGQVPGGGYSVRFKNPAGQVIVSTPFNQGPVVTVGRTTLNGNPSLGTTTSVVNGASRIGGIGGAIDSIILYAGDNTIEQNLPIDPSGIVYDSVTRRGVGLAVVTLIGPDGNPVPAANLVERASTQTTPDTGIYMFNLEPTAPSGRYRLQITPPATYSATPAVQGGVSLPGVAPNTSIGSIANGVYTPPGNGSALVSIQSSLDQPAFGVNTAGAVGTSGTQYFLEFNFTVGGPNQSSGVIRNHIPLDPLAAGAILVSKVGDKSVAEVGDSVRYTISLRNTAAGNIAGVKLEDLLPAGFRYIPGTARLNSATLVDPAGGVGRALTFDIGNVAGNSAVQLSYYARLGVGSQQGDGINRATAVFNGANGPVRSNTAQYKVIVQGGVLGNDGCIIGKVYVDCDGNHVQNNESGSRELGIPGVRLLMLDGSYVITDNEGKYSICGVKPQTHVIKVDRSTLPKGSRLLPSSNRNAGVGDSIFVDLKGGELGRADFIEGSCSPEVLDQVKARRAQGGVLAPETEKRPDLKIDNRPAEAQQQILPGVRPDVPGGTRP